MYEEKQMKKDKKRLFKAGIIFCVWLIAVFYIGSNLSKSSTEHAKSNPKITQGTSPTGEGLSDSQKTAEQKEKIRQANTGFKVSEQTKQKLSIKTSNTR